MGRLYFSNADFCLENPYWNGMSGLSSATDVHPLYGISGLSGVSGNDTLLIVSPLVNYSKEESAYVRSFLERGGKVIVMDDYGVANSLLNNLSAPITLYPVPLCQDMDYYKEQSFPVIKNIAPSWETAKVSSLTFNHPVSLSLSGDARAIALTSVYGWLDLNDSSRLEKNELMGMYPVIASWSRGRGELIVIGDPDLLANSVIDQTDNRIFMRNVLKGTVWVDVSHGRGVTPLAMVYYEVKNNPILQLFVVLLISACGFAYLRRDRVVQALYKLAGKDKKESERRE
jgi:hypothetical protein